MKKIAILDTWVNDTNLGNKIIMESVYKHLRQMFPGDFFYQVPALEYIQAGRKIVESADYIFLAGTNLLSSDMRKTSEWRLRISDLLWMKNVILMGVGWWQYQKQNPNLYTNIALRKLLSKKHCHSVRDSYTVKKLSLFGIRIINTGCPTLWGLNDDHITQITPTKNHSVLLTFTEYNKHPNYDRILFEILKNNYEVLYFWPQMYGDYQYAKEICDKNLIFIDPSVEALDDLLRKKDVDYIGTRLHAGIRALQNKCRTIIIAIDNRSIEMGMDFNLPIIHREEIQIKLPEKINSYWMTEMRINQQAILKWKGQFQNNLNT